MTRVIQTQILSEELIPWDVPGAMAPDGATPIFEMLGGALYSQDIDIDAAGQTHDVFVTGLVVNNNITWGEYRVVPPHPGPYPREAHTRIEASQKIDTVAMSHSGADVHLMFTTHETIAGNRRLRKELAVIPGTWRTAPGFEQEKGGAGAYRGGDVLPPSETEVDYQRIEDIVEFQLNEKLNGLREEFGGGSIRNGIEEKVKDGVSEILDPADPRGRVYQDRLFQFVKNANAGVQANILGGQDAWGVNRRNELKQIIREVLQEIDTDERGEQA